MRQDDILDFLKENGPSTVREIVDSTNNPMSVRGGSIYRKLRNLENYEKVRRIERENTDTLWEAVQ